MFTNDISGAHALSFVRSFDYIREAGTDGELRAAEAIVSAVRELGAEPVTEEFEIPVQTVDKAVFCITHPYVKEYPIGGYRRSGNTPAGGIDAPFLYAENGDDISLMNAKGRIVLVNDPMRPPMYEKLNAAGAAAFLTVIGTPLDEGVDRIPADVNLFRGAPEDIPGGMVHILDAAELAESFADEAHFELIQHAGTAISRNVICRVNGTGAALGNEMLTVTAHFDSVPAGVGAYDNMAACGIVYELLAHFLKHPPKRTIDFVFFGAEEKGLCGSRAYCRTHAEELDRHRFNMNIDLAGQTVGGTVFGVTAEHEAGEVLRGIAAETGIGATVRNAVWSSDSNTFAAYGIPAMTLNRDGFGMHTRHDTMSLISAWSLERSTLLLGAVADRLANADTFPFERKVPEEYLQKLNGLTK